jgi:hypothetical protein
MGKVILCTSAALAAATLGACEQKPPAVSQASYEYTFAESGPPETRDRRVWESLNDVTFSRVQKYKLVGKTDITRTPHFVVISVTKRLGKKVEVRDAVMPVFVKDGVYDMECAGSYDVKPAQEESVDDPTCSIKLLGVLKPDAPATLQKS